MTKKQRMVKDKKVRALLRKGGRTDAKKDFFELLRRATNEYLNSK